MVTYRTAGPWGAGKGSNLSPAEVDANFYELQQAINAALAGLDDPVGIEDITYDNGTLTFVLSDATTRGPFDLPIAVFQWRGRWAPMTSYAEFDVLYHPSLGGYLVLKDHTSGSTFDPSLQVGGSPAYRLLWRMIPGGLWPIKGVSTNSYTLALTDAQHYLRMTSGSETVITVPTNAAVAFPIATEIMVRAAGQPLVHLTGATGVTLNLPTGTSGLSDLGGVAYLKKVDTNEWDIWYGGESGEMPTMPSFPTESEASESEGSGSGNLQVGDDGTGMFGVTGYSSGWNDTLMIPDMGSIVNPINGYNVSLFVNFGTFAGYLAVEVPTDAETEVDFPTAFLVKIGAWEELYVFNQVANGSAIYVGLTPPFGYTDSGEWFSVELTASEAPSEPSETESESETPPTEYAYERLLDYDFFGTGSAYQYYNRTFRQRIRAAWLRQPGTHIRLGIKSGTQENSTDEIYVTDPTSDIFSDPTTTEDKWWNDGLKVLKVFIGKASGDGFDFDGTPVEVTFNGGQSGFEVPPYGYIDSETYYDEVAATGLSDFIPFEITGDDDIIIAVSLGSDINKANFYRNHRISGSSRLAWAYGDSADDTGPWTPEMEISSTWSNMLEVFDVAITGTSVITDPTDPTAPGANLWSETRNFNAGYAQSGVITGGQLGQISNPIDGYDVRVLYDDSSNAILRVTEDAGLPSTLTVSAPGLTTRVFTKSILSGGLRHYSTTGRLGFTHNRWYVISIT